MKPDILVYLRNGENEELRYAIRSWVQNLEFGRIFAVSGSKPPKWFHPDTLIINPEQLAKTRQAYNNIQLGLQDPRLSQQLLLLMDDVFVLKKIGKWPENFNYNRGQLVHQWGVGTAKYGENSYQCQLRLTYEALKRHFPEPLSFEEHTPFWCEKDKMLKIFEIYGSQLHHYLPRSLYGNIYGISTDYKPDLKISSCDQKIPTGEKFLSTCDTTFRLGEVGTYLKKKFPTPSKYEG